METAVDWADRVRAARATRRRDVGRLGFTGRQGFSFNHEWTLMASSNDYALMELERNLSHGEHGVEMRSRRAHALVVFFCAEKQGGGVVVGRKRRWAGIVVNVSLFV